MGVQPVLIRTFRSETTTPNENILMIRWREPRGASASAEEYGLPELREDKPRRRGHKRCSAVSFVIENLILVQSRSLTSAAEVMMGEQIGRRDTITEVEFARLSRWSVQSYHTRSSYHRQRWMRNIIVFRERAAPLRDD
jgi:hypothetical protein